MQKKDALNIRTSENTNGITIRTKKGTHRLTYPGRIWATYPGKARGILIDNLAHLLTIDIPLVSHIRKIGYNTSLPLFRPFFHSIVLNSIPPSVEVKQKPTDVYIKRLFNTDYKFKDTCVKLPSYSADGYTERAVVTLSFGKDSLLTLGLAMELGLDPVAVYINDTVSPAENEAKARFLKGLSRELGLAGCLIRNEIEKINDFETWGTEETCLSYNHMMTGFCMLSLPVAHYYKAGYIMVGNQQDMNFKFTNKDGYITTASPDQHYEWTRHQDSIIRLMTAGRTRAVSLIEPLTDIAITGILYTRYRDIARYQFSCDSLDASLEDRWCQACSKCARTSLYMKAFGIDTRDAGYRRGLLGRSDKRFYILFDGREVDRHEEGEDARDEQLLAFYMAYKRGEEGPLIDLFKKSFLKEAKRRSTALKRRFFGIYDSEVTHPLKKRVGRILKEALKGLKYEHIR